MRSFQKRGVLLTACAVTLLLAGAAWLYASGLRVVHPVTTVAPGRHALGHAKRLVVFVPGTGGRVASYRLTMNQLLAEPKLVGSDLLLFDHKIVRLTPGHADDFATRLRAEIDAQWIRAGGYDDIILAGGSLGSLLVRQAYLASAGADPRQPRTVPWSDRVSRIVLMPGIGRGINIENEGRWKWVLRICRYIPLLRSSLIYEQLRGADFVTAVRIGWIRHFAAMYTNYDRDSSSLRPPTVVQLLGTEDDYVSRDDNIDFDQFRNAFHIDVPGARHETVFRLEPGPDSLLRYALFREAFTSTAPAHALAHRESRDSVKRVIFLLHGIRSSREDWVRTLAPVLRTRIPDAEVVESSYGQISMLGFALPNVRRRERRWFQDQYTEYLARHPFAKLDVIAHSNGTYLLGQSLERIPVMRFDRLALLASVLPADYEWRQRHALGQVQTVRSDRAADDWIVALLANGLRGIGMLDVGTSGWLGFNDAGDFLLEPPSLPGGHVASLAPANLAGVVDFIATGRISAAELRPSARPTMGLRWASGVAPWFTFSILVVSVMLLIKWVRNATGVSRRSRASAIVVVMFVLAILLDVL